MSDETAAKPGIDDSLLHEWAEHDCGPPKEGCNAAMRFEHGPRTHLARALLASQSALAEAKAEIEGWKARFIECDEDTTEIETIERLRSVLNAQAERIAKLEAALAEITEMHSCGDECAEAMREFAEAARKEGST